MDALWIMLAGLIGLALGGAIGYLLMERRGSAALSDAEKALAESHARLEALREQISQQATTIKSASDERATLVREHETRLDALRDQVATLKIDAQKLTTELAAERANLAEQKKLLAEAETKFKDVFAGVGSEALDKNSKAFLELAKQRFETLTKQADGTLAERQEKIATLIGPMTTLLQKYEERLKDVEKARSEDKQQLTGLLASLRESHQRLDTQTNQLVSALRRPTTRGRWGEITLRRLVEMAGMSSYCDFCEQVSVDTDDGKLRPDMIVTLPNDRRVVIDSKVVYDNFADGLNESDEQRKAEFFRLHARAVRSRCDDLSRKSYQDQFEGSLEFVVMFLPGEAFLYAAVEQDPGLIEDALKNKVVVATPTTLVSLLKAIEFGWRQQKVADNAAEILELGEQLHQRIGVFVEHFCKLGKNLDAAADAYNAAMTSLERNLLLTAQRMEEHSLKSKKQLPVPDGIDRRIESPSDRAGSAIARAVENGMLESA